MTSYKYILMDEFGWTVRKFVSKSEAQIYLTPDTKLVRLPAQPSQYQIAMLTLSEAPF
jgi:hypothetical protein